MKCEEGAIRFAANKDKGRNEDDKSLIPGSGSLFEAIEGLTKMTHMINKLRVDVAWWLTLLD